MARLARVVVPNLPHHVTQRGNGRARTFFSDADYALYRDLLAHECRAAGVTIWSWVLMPNHVHLILVPADPDGLRRALAAVHRRYAGHIHARQKRTGHFWQGRFGAVAMDEAHAAAALVYGAMNPVRARLVPRPQDWPWSSAAALLRGRGDGITDVAAVRRVFPRLRELLTREPPPEAQTRLRRAETIGRPIGSETFLSALESRLARPLRPAKPGPKPGPDPSGEGAAFRASSP
jgi:putative transposase